MKILINRSDAIGEAILTMPMAKILKENYPDSHITMLVTAKSVDLFKEHPYIDDFKVYHRSVSFYKKFKQIIKVFGEVKPTHYFYVGGGYFPNFISWMLRVPFRGGFKAKWHTYLFLNTGIRQKRSMVTMHEMEYNLNLLTPLNIIYNYKNREKYSPEIYLNVSEKELNFNLFNKKLAENGFATDRKMIFIHPGMAGDSLNWSSVNYGRLILKLNILFPNKYLFVISHTPSDHIYLEGLKKILNRKENRVLQNQIYYFNGQEDGLRHYLAVLSKAMVFIGPSTGNTHMAAALGIPVVGIFSPIKNQSALRFGPLTLKNAKSKILVPDVICGEVKKCALKECPYYECMGKIEVEDVAKQILAVMN
jgi:heptosyltransferase-3